MIALLLLLAAAVTLVGATYEVSLLAVSRHELADAVAKRLRGDEVPLVWSADVARRVSAASATTSIGVILIGVALPALGAGRPGLEVALALLVLAVPLAVVGGYLLPRWLSRGRAERAVALLGPVVSPWARVLGTVLPATADAEADLKVLGREGAALAPEGDVEMAMVGGVITFARRPVREVMTPRTEIVAVPEGAPVAEITRTVAESGYSRIPVYRETLDEIVGMVHAFDLFRLREGDPLPVRPVAVTPESRSCGDLLLDMQRERRHLAVVVDEFGGTGGIATLEDLLTALVGEIYDEGEPLPVEPGAEAPLLEADGGLAVEAVEERFSLTLPAGEATTIGGRLAELAGRILLTGERVRVAGLEFDVLQASPNRIERLIIRREARETTILKPPSAE